MLNRDLIAGKAEMKIIVAHDHYTDEHLVEVKAEMATMGAPVVKCSWIECYGAWMALEGCHRLRAAHDLGLAPVIDAVEFDPDQSLNNLGCDYQDDLTMGELLDDAHNRAMLRFEAVTA